MPTGYCAIADVKSSEEPPSIEIRRPFSRWGASLPYYRLCTRLGIDVTPGSVSC